MGKKQYLLWAGIMMAASLPIHAQRMQQELGRGVVAVQNGSNVLISWRKLVQELENARYNVYCKRANGGSFTKLNQQPLSKTNFSINVGAGVSLIQHLEIGFTYNIACGKTGHSIIHLSMFLVALLKFTPIL